MAMESSAWESSIANFCGMETSGTSMYTEDSYTMSHEEVNVILYLSLLLFATILLIVADTHLSTNCDLCTV